jgi:hypothetical protein
VYSLDGSQQLPLIYLRIVIINMDNANNNNGNDMEYHVLYEKLYSINTKVRDIAVHPNGK